MGWGENGRCGENRRWDEVREREVGWGENGRWVEVRTGGGLG